MAPRRAGAAVAVVVMLTALTAGLCGCSSGSSSNHGRQLSLGADRARTVRGGPLPLGPITPSTEVFGGKDLMPAIGAPISLVIDAIGVRSPVVPLGRNPDNTMQTPDRFDQTGWYTGGPQPGQYGPAVIAGHVDSYTGPAVFFRLKDLKPGDLVTVIGGRGRAQFRIDSVQVFAKDTFPTDLVFGPTPARALRLITCGGSFDRSTGSYRDNVVAFATESGESIDPTSSTTERP